VLDKTPTPFTAHLLYKKYKHLLLLEIDKICISSQNSPTEPKPVEMALKTSCHIKIVIHD
jgi:hypothetical protein